MSASIDRRACLLAIAILSGFSVPALAQSIVPAADGTGTIVQTVNQQINLTGGTQSGSNLFHSFQKFGLTPGQTATFLTHPNIQNILGRVTGGEASVINGRLQVSGGAANLYLVNPAGIVFGPQASLSVPAAFTATTASAIGFANGAWLSTIATPDYANLLGAPTAFAFPLQSGAIVNTANLEVNPGQALALIGGTVLNAGQLNAPGGQITLLSVVDNQTVRLSQPGSLLSFELTRSPDLATLPFSPQSLPALLTTGHLEPVTGITVNPDGSLRLPNASQSLAVLPGTTIVTGQVSTATPTQSGGVVQILGDRVALVGATIDASGRNGGTVRVGGDQRGQGTIPNAAVVFADPNTILRADGVAPQQNGQGDQNDSLSRGGQVVVWSDFATRFFGSISARGGDIGGTVEVSSRDSLTFRGKVDTFGATTPGLFLLDPSFLRITDTAVGDLDGFLPNLSTAPDTGANTVSWGAIASLASTTNVILEATGLITIDDITGFVSGTPDLISLPFDTGSLTIRSLAGAVQFADLNDTIETQGGALTFSGTQLTLGNLSTSALFRAGNISLSSQGSLEVGSLNAQSAVDQGGNVTLNALTNIRADNIVTTGFLEGGAVLIASTNGGITIPNGILTTSSTRSAGAIGVSAAANISLGDVDASNFNFGQGNSIQIGSSGGTVTTGTVAAQGENGGGAVMLSTGGSAKDIQVNAISTQSSLAGTGGIVTIAASGLFRAIATLTSSPSASISSAGVSGGGAVSITHGGDTTNPFGVGDASANGTAGSITSGSSTIAPTQSFSTTFSIGNISITANPIPILEPVVTPSPPVFTETETNRPVATPSPMPDPAPLLEHPTIPAVPKISTEVAFPVEEVFTREYATHLGLATPPILSLTDVQQKIVEMERSTHRKVAFLYARFVPPNSYLDLTLVTSRDRTPRTIAVSRPEVTQIAQKFSETVSRSSSTSAEYLPLAQQLYQWMIAPFKSQLQAQGIEHLVLIVDQSLRSVPFSALHDGQSFLAETYSLSLMPSFSLTAAQSDRSFRFSQNTLAMGTTKFMDQAPLAAVPYELALATQPPFQGVQGFDQGFRFDLVRSQLLQRPYQVVHLATHARFEPGDPSHSYIQLRDRPLQLSQVNQLYWHNTDLLVLSACQTALGDRQAELGFAGVAAKLGARSVMGSLWQVDDLGTLMLMQQLYGYLSNTLPQPTQALQQAQISLLRGTATLTDRQLPALPSELASWDSVKLQSILEFNPQLLSLRRSHPFYWAGFTLIGYPF